jgi:glycosyltransferase involved in cell wall biosynthesis
MLNSFAKRGASIKPRPKILTFLRYYLPGYKSGGPIRTISNLVAHLGNDLEFYIVTSDRDATDSVPYNSVTVDEWNTVGNAKVFYASPYSLSFKSFLILLKDTPCDAIYLNSFFDPTFTLFPLIARSLGLIQKRPLIIAPRGEFSKGALALKAWKKKPYLILAKSLKIYSNLFWQASSRHEAEDIRRSFGQTGLKVSIAPNLPPFLELPNLDKFTPRSTEAPLRIIFLSRITPMKNLDLALSVLAKVNARIEMGIYGPIRDEVYWQHCQHLMEMLPTHVHAAYYGSIQPELVPQLLASYDLFFLPTKGENFGHVILEALCVGTPVLISDQTPWSHDNEGGCTTCTIDDRLGFISEIERFARLSDNEQQSARRAANAVARSFIKNSSIKEKNFNLFFEALSCGKD